MNMSVSFLLLICSLASLNSTFGRAFEYELGSLVIVPCFQSSVLLTGTFSSSVSLVLKRRICYEDGGFWWA